MKNTFIFLAMLVFLIALWFILSRAENKGDQTESSEKRNKDDLAKYYSVSRQTLQKWIQHFPVPHFDLKRWKKTRKLTEDEILSIKHVWGDDPKGVLNKKQIIDKAESTYKVLTQEVKRKLEKIGISLETWKTCSVFPPTISQNILDSLV